MPWKKLIGRLKPFTGTTALMACLTCTAWGQEPGSITADVMPEAGSTLRYSLGAAGPGMDFAATGTNHNWDFSGLQTQSQYVDSLVALETLDALTQVFFGFFLDPDRATHALKSPSFEIPVSLDSMSPGIRAGSFQFFRTEEGRHVATGFAFQVDNVVVPVRYSSPDTLFPLPLRYGMRDTSISSFGFPPGGANLGLGFSFELHWTRKMEVDGWGRLETPFGSFDALRLQSSLQQTAFIQDSTGIDTVPLPLTREYLWLTPDTSVGGAALLRVTATGEGEQSVITSVTWRDKEREPAPIVLVPQAGGMRSAFATRSDTGFRMEFLGSDRMRVFDVRGRAMAPSRIP